MDIEVKQILYRVLAELTELRAEVRGLTATIEAGMLVQPQPKPDDVVGAEYVASRFGCSVRSVREGKAGTHHVHWRERRPLRTTRGEVDNALARYVEPLTTCRVPSLVRRKPRVEPAGKN